MTESELLLSEFPIARQKLLADFQGYVRQKERFGCKHYYGETCRKVATGELDDECECESGLSRKFSPEINYDCFEPAEFKSYVECMSYNKLELAEMNTLAKLCQGK